MSELMSWSPYYELLRGLTLGAFEGHPMLAVVFQPRPSYASSAGFNQSALLGREIAAATGASLLVDGLVRRKATPMLGGLGRAARMRALSGAIAVNPARAARIKGKQVLLVDDVLTSGSTSETCVKALKRAGAAKVRISPASMSSNKT